MQASPRNRERLFGGINPAFRVGGHFIKRVALGGSPHAEGAASQLFSTLGTPHNPVTPRAGRKGHFVISAYEPKLYSISHLFEKGRPDPTHLLQNHQQHLNTLFTEWLGNLQDRHGGNYAVHPRHGIISIDHGESFHPGTAQWSEGRTHPDFSMTQARHWSFNPNRSALATLLTRPQFSHGLDRAAVDPVLISRALGEREKLGQLAHSAAHGLGPEEQRLSQAAMENRLQTLSLRTNRPLTLAVLQELHQRALERAQRATS